MSSPNQMMQRALALYDREPLGIRLFVRARHLLTPLERVAEYVPRQGRMLDLGCGHGLFSHLLALQSPARWILGVDPAAAKIAVAARVGRELPNVRYCLGTADSVAAGRFDAITICDVLYLLEPAAKAVVVRRCRELLAPGGVLVLKTNDTRPRWKYEWARFEEVLMTRLGLTLGHGELHFYSAEQHRQLLREHGFEVETIDLNSWLPYPHMLFVARPLAGAPPGPAGEHAAAAH